jgi:hypothetical protein
MALEAGLDGGRLGGATGVTWKWISEQLHMGTWTHAASRLYHAREMAVKGSVLIIYRNGLKE